MRKTQTVVFSVMHHANLPFFSSYLNSLVNQTEKNFDVLLLIDNVSNIDDLLKPFQDLLTIHLLHRTGSLASIRMEAIEWLDNAAYDFVIFSDSDDLNAPDRVHVCCKALESYPVVVNDVSPFTEEANVTWKGYWSSRLSKDFLFTSRDIERFNYAGLGNSAVRREIVSQVKIPSSLVAIDWFLFYLWMDDAEGIFSHEGIIAYRQHPANLVGLEKITKQRIHQTLEVKLAHYNALGHDFPHLKKYIGESERKLLQIRDDRFLSQAIEKLNTNEVNYFWWEETEYMP